MKKRIVALLVILGLFLPYGQAFVFANQQETDAQEQLKISADASTKQLVLDEAEVKVTAAYVETETDLQWTIEFEKKATENEGRIRLAIDTTANGFGTVSDIRGQGLSASDPKTLKTMKVEKDEQNLDWYYGKEYSAGDQKGKLTFTSKKTDSDPSDLPLLVAVDEKIAEKKVDISETEQTATDSEETAVSSDSSEQPVEATEELTELTKNSGKVFYRNPVQALADKVNLGPFSEKDPFYYSSTGQQRYPNHSTNSFATNDSFDKDQTYQGEHGKLHENGALITDEQSLADGQIVAGGANWRNYDYASDEKGFALPGAEGFAKTTQLWGADRNFTNSYLDYNGAYMKKWVEPVTDHVGGEQDGTTIYNVYLDVIGGTLQEKKPLDIVFVIDKSSSMSEKFTIDNTGPTKYDVMQSSMKKTIEDLFRIQNLDLRVGFVDFGSLDPMGSTFTEKTTQTFPLNGNRDQLLDEQKNQALFGPLPSNGIYSGTPLSLGIKKGYEALYANNGAAGRQPEKILIVVGDGMPTYSYSGFRHNPDASDNDHGRWVNDESNVSKYWAYDSDNQFIRNYETMETQYDSAKFKPNEYYPTEFDPNLRPEGSNYRYGETDELLSVDWYGNGRTSMGLYNKQNAIHTIAYHNWLKNRYIKKTGITPRVFSIGVGLQGERGPGEEFETPPALLDALGRNVLKNIADLKGTDSTDSYYYGADSQQEFMDALQSILGDFVNIVQKATLYDETGTNVSLYNVSNSAKIEYYHLDRTESGKYKSAIPWDERIHGTQPQVEATAVDYGSDGTQNQAYRFDNLSLGDGDMVRIRYQVILDAGAQDGKFYAVDGQTYLINQADISAQDKRMYLPAPSIRYAKNSRALHVKKTDENGLPIANVELGLYTKNGESYELIEQKTTDKNGRAIFTEQISILNNEDSKIYYVKELSAPKQYQLIEDYLSFQLHKSLAVDEKLGHYELVEANTTGKLASKTDAKEDLWPYIIQGDNHTFSIVQTLTEPINGLQDFDELYVNLDLTNQLKPIVVDVNKTIEGTDMPLPGATFQLLKEVTSNGVATYKEVGTGISDKEGKVIFKDASGSPVYLEEAANQDYTNYHIVETETPDGYEKPGKDDYWIIQLDHQKKMIKHQRNGAGDDWKSSTYEALTEEDAIHLSIDITNKMTKRDFMVEKVDEAGNPLNGVGFELNKVGDEEVFKAYSGISGYETDAIVRKDGWGAFYSKLADQEKYQDQDYTKPLVLTAGTYKVTETDGLLGYTVMQKEFEFTVDETGAFKYSNDSDHKYQFAVTENDQLLTLTVKNESQPLALEFQKMDSHSKKPVAGAAFEIATWDEATEKWNAGVALVSPKEDGTLFQLDPLEIGRYKITETAPPKGYRGFPGHIELKVSIREKDEKDGDILYEKGSVKAEFVYYDEVGVEIENSRQLATLKETGDEDAKKVLISFEVENDPTFSLPSTGGQGRMGYYLVSAFLIGMTLILGFYYYQRTQRRGE